MTAIDLTTVASDVERARSCASHLAQLRALDGDRRQIRAATTLARSRWTELKAHERALYDWLDEYYGDGELHVDAWIFVLRVYEGVVNARRAIEEAGKEEAA